MKKMKSLLASTLVILMILSMTACENGTDTAVTSSVTPSGAASLTASNSSENDTETVQKMVFFAVCEAIDPDAMVELDIWKEFEKENNCDITVQLTTSDTFKEQYSTLVSSGAQLDVIGLNAQDMRYLYASNSVFALDDYITVDSSNYAEGALDLLSWNDKVYGLPYTSVVSAMSLYYNKDIFKELNLKQPQTFDELYEVSDKLRVAGYFPISMAGGNLYNWPTWYMTTFGQLLGSGCLQYTVDILNGDKKFTDAVCVEAMQAIGDLAKHGVFDNGFLGTTESDAAIAIFTQGQAAMHNTGSWNITSMMNAGMQDNLGIMPFPLIREGLTYCTQANVCNPAVAGYAKSTVDKALIAKFCEFVSGVEFSNEALLAKANGDMTKSFDIPVTLGTNARSFPIADQIQKEFVPMADPYLDWYWPAEITAEIQIQCQAVAGGDRSAADAMQAVQDLLDKLFSEGYKFV